VIATTETERPMRVVVCGTTFGQIYLEALRRPQLPFELSGILARGSARSHACAERFGVPLFTDVAELPQDTDIACVVVRSGAFGGQGTALCKALMTRGINVIQEHPVHHDELAECLAHARRHRVVYRLNTFYPHLAPVRRFIGTAQRLLARQPPVFVDAACAVQVSYPLLDMLAQAIGGVRPCELAALEPGLEPHEDAVPFCSLQGVIAAVPFTLRVQNEMDPSDPDNHLHLLHRITIGTESGSLTLVDTHGPLLWSPRLHIPAAMKDTFDIAGCESEHLDLVSAGPIGPPAGLTFREILGSTWPAGVATALLELRGAILSSEDPRRLGQYHLALCTVWQDLTSRLGYPQLTRHAAPEALAASELTADVVTVR
jgi:pyochelin biosynthesis protein PchG